MDQASVARRLRKAGVPDFVTPNRLETLARLSGIYQQQKLLSATAAPALHSACPDGDACWKDLPEAARPHAGDRSYGLSGDEPGSIIWPWVGEHYASAGVVLLTLNFKSSDTEASVALEYLAAWHTRESLEAGHERSLEDKSPFGYHLYATAAAVISSLEGGLPALRPVPEPLVDTMERVAHLQLVKCTPVDKVVDRGRPTRTMCHRCPQRFLWPELADLAPRVLVVFGRPAYEELNRADGVRWRCGTYLCRGTLQYGDNGQAILLWVPHPSASDWPQGQAALVRSLRRKPLGGA